MLLSIILYAGKDLSLPLRLLSFSAGISARQEVEHFSAGDTTNLELNPSPNERFHLECETLVGDFPTLCDVGFEA